MRVRDAANWARASSGARERLFDKEIDGFSIDSRATAPGELFFALSPEDYRRHCFTATSFADAHRFIPQAFEQGRLSPALGTLWRQDKLHAQLQPHGAIGETSGGRDWAGLTG